MKIGGSYKPVGHIVCAYSMKVKFFWEIIIEVEWFHRLEKKKTNPCDVYELIIRKTNVVYG